MPDPGEAFHETPPDGFPIAPVAYDCPRCGHTVEVVPRAVAHLAQCPTCHEHFVIPSESGSTDLPDENDAHDADAAAADKEGELDSLRMRNVVVLRRAAMRSRGYAIIGACICLTAAVKLITMIVQEVRGHGWHVRQVLFAVFAAVSVLGIPYFIRRAAHWAREGRTSVLADPDTPPDFSTLSDGTQHARNLDDIK
jgi:hypothetical protein